MAISDVVTAGRSKMALTARRQKETVPAVILVILAVIYI
jgi:hypothetical protein